MTRIEKAILICVLLLTGFIIGYTWHIVQVALAYTPPPHTIAFPEIKAAMGHMGPRYDYRMVGETLYVDTGTGYKRLRYREGE